MARALYIHWPFCLAKCPYCDFNSHVRDSVDTDLWQRAMLDDMRLEADLASGETLTSIFFGGGTPSLMPPALVEALLAQAQRLWGFADDIEITLEANPSSVETDRFAALAASGINRVSLGLQSMDDAALRLLGRLHDAREGIAALDVAQHHFARVSFDLIYALPQQSVQHWQQQLSRALGFGTGHLSLYQLTIEPGTRFATMVRERTLTPLDDDAAADLFAATRELTGAAGLPAYEVSNHARPGEESRHNLAYWEYRDYCGIGPGAHGRRGGVATVRHRKPENWLTAIAATGHGISEERALGRKEQAAEAMLMGLRLARGIALPDLAERLSIPMDDFCDSAKVDFYSQQGLLQHFGDRLVVTPTGMSVLEGLLREIVSPGLLAA